MRIWQDVHNRRVRFTDERWEHIRTEHPEMSEQEERIRETLLTPDIILRSRTAPDIELLYRDYRNTPVTRKYLCIVLKIVGDDVFIITAYFTDTIKKGKTLWEKK